MPAFDVINQYDYFCFQNIKPFKDRRGGSFVPERFSSQRPPLHVGDGPSTPPGSPPHDAFELHSSVEGEGEAAFTGKRPSAPSSPPRISQKTVNSNHLLIRKKREVEEDKRQKLSEPELKRAKATDVKVKPKPPSSAPSSPRPPPPPPPRPPPPRKNSFSGAPPPPPPKPATPKPATPISAPPKRKSGEASSLSSSKTQNATPSSPKAQIGNHLAPIVSDDIATPLQITCSHSNSQHHQDITSQLHNPEYRPVLPPRKNSFSGAPPPPPAPPPLLPKPATPIEAPLRRKNSGGLTMTVNSCPASPIPAPLRRQQSVSSHPHHPQANQTQKPPAPPASPITLGESSASRTDSQQQHDLTNQFHNHDAKPTIKLPEGCLLPLRKKSSVPPPSLTPKGTTSNPAKPILARQNSDRSNTSANSHQTQKPAPPGPPKVLGEPFASHTDSQREQDITEQLHNPDAKPTIQLPEGWVCVWSKSQKRWYFFDTRANKSVWDIERINVTH